MKTLMVIKKKKLNNQGMTMVEIMVGFVILVVLMGGLFNLISFSSNMVKNSVDMKNAQIEVWSEAYKNEPGDVVSGITFSIREKNVDSAETIPLDTFQLRCVEQSGDIDGNKLKMYVFSAVE